VTIAGRDSAYYELRQPLSQDGEAFSGRLPKMFINFEEFFFSRGYEKLEQQNKTWSFP
jgi:hypothetical protein